MRKYSPLGGRFFTQAGYSLACLGEDRSLSSIPLLEGENNTPYSGDERGCTMKFFCVLPALVSAGVAWVLPNTPLFAQAKHEITKNGLLISGAMICLFDKEVRETMRKG